MLQTSVHEGASWHGAGALTPQPVGANCEALVEGVVRGKGGAHQRKKPGQKRPDQKYGPLWWG